MHTHYLDPRSAALVQAEIARKRARLAELRHARIYAAAALALTLTACGGSDAPVDDDEKKPIDPPTCTVQPNGSCR